MIKIINDIYLTNYQQSYKPKNIEKTKGPKSDYDNKKKDTEELSKFKDSDNAKNKKFKK